MANSPQLETLAALVERLAPLGQKTRGMRIEADEWNALVDVLQSALDVERTQVQTTEGTLAQTYALREHEHLGQVSVSWLDADLQSRLGAQTGSVPTRVTLAELEQKITSLGGEVARLTALVGDQQRQLDRAAVSDLDKGRKLNQFDDRFAGVENLRSLVSVLSTDVGAVRTNVDTVLELRKSLTDAQGQPINVAQLQNDLKDVQGLRENLLGADGKLVRLRDVDLKLSELSDAVGAGSAGGLDTRIGAAVGAAETRLDGRADERIKALQGSFGADLQTRDTQLLAAVTGQIEQARVGLDLAGAQRVSESEARLNAGFTQQLETSANSVRTDTLAQSTQLIDSRLASVPDQVRVLTNTAVDALRGGLEQSLRASSKADLDAFQAQLEASLDPRFAAGDARVQQLESSLPGMVQARTDELAQTLESRTAEQLSARLDEARKALEQSVSSQVKEQTASTLGDVDARVSRSVDSKLVDLDARIEKSVANATRDLPRSVTDAVSQQLATLDIAKQISDGDGKLGSTLRAEQAQALSDLQARTATQLGAAATQLRGETGALRAELSTAIDTRLNSTSTALRKELSTGISQLEGRIRPESFRTPLQPTRPLNP
jgi:hypothetical protein